MIEDHEIYAVAHPFAGIGSLLYLIIGLVVANSYGYFNGVSGSLPNLISAMVAVPLWPAILLGVDLHIDALPLSFQDLFHSQNY